MIQWWIILAPSILLIVAVLALYPHEATRAAILRHRRPSGGWNRRRLRTEIRSAGRFLGRALGLPLAFLGLVQVSLILVLEWAVAGSLLVALFRGHHPKVSVHHAEIDKLLSWAAESRRELAESGASSADLLELWPLWPAYLIVTFFLVGYYLTRRLPRHIRRYVRSAGRRSRTRHHSAKGSADATT